MFHHNRKLQYNAKPDRPDPLFARQLQEALGGQWGEISLMMSYLFQGWNCRGPAKYRDMLLDIGTEEIAHVEMVATMIARLLEKSPVDATDAAAKDPALRGIMGGATVSDVLLAGMNPQHVIVTGGGASATDSAGYPWTSRYTIASGNLMADFHFNVTAECQSRLQLARLYELTGDAGVRDMLSFLIARDTMHQNQFLAAIEELQHDGLESMPVPHSLSSELENRAVAYQYWNCSNGVTYEARWLAGLSPDGRGEFTVVSPAEPMGEEPYPGAVDPRLHGTPRGPMTPTA
ncbi:MAG: manganese catalase family protein [Acidobacteria bacterium]|nr:manganese catalase family protein [Acidobacteriota bacterium]